MRASRIRARARDSAAGRFGGEFGLAEAGAAAEPVPPVPGADHAGVVPSSGRVCEGEAAEVGGRPIEQCCEHEREGVVPGIGEP